MLLTSLALCALLQTSAADTVRATWTPHRVWDARADRLADFETLAAAAARAEVVFFGEQHDDPGTHRLELALLEAVARRRADVVVSVEMFERDVQATLDRYLAGEITEAEFLKSTRPWPNYVADYRPLIEFAKAHRWRVVAANVPRPLAQAVARGGLDTLARLGDSTRRWAAAEFQCGPGRYFDRFAEAMGGHGAPGSDAAAATLRYYQSQCVKDETMAESIARARAASPGALVIHYNGSFHSDYGDGTAERVRRRLPAAAVMVVTAQPKADVEAPVTAEERAKGDWIVTTLAAKKQP